MKLANAKNLVKARVESGIKKLHGAQVERKELPWIPVGTDTTLSGQFRIAAEGTLTIENATVIQRGQTVVVLTEYMIDNEGGCWKRVIGVEHRE